jgi:hypothetical protein
MLDRKRPFGKVYGDPVIGFEQDGKMFDKMGQEIVAESQIPLTHSDKMKLAWARRKESSNSSSETTH